MGSGGVLAGIRVVEFAQNAAIPYCGRLLAGMGADVVKVEPPGGDAMRNLSQLAPNEAKTYAVINPGKRGVVLDLASDGAPEVIDALFAWADVALVAFKQGDLARYGIHWEHARTVNPRLVHLTHTPFGPKGPDANSGGYDVLVQARSGNGFIMNRTTNGVPISSRPAVNDFGTGISSALGVVAALRYRDLTGQGQRVDTSLLGTAMAFATPVASKFDATDGPILDQLDSDLAELQAAGADFETQRKAYEDRVIPSVVFRLYFRHYMTADGLVTVAGLSKGLFKKFHAVTQIGRPTPGEGLETLVNEAEAVFRTRTTADWMQLLRAAGYPCGPYNLPHQALEDEQVRANDFAVEIENPIFGTYTTTGHPVQFSAAPNVAFTPSPGLGEHNREVLGEIGFEPENVKRIMEAGVVQDAKHDAD